MRPVYGGFAEKTLRSTSNILEKSLFLEEFVSRVGLLQQIDPGAKLISTLLLLLAAALTRNIEVLLGLYALTLLMALASGIPLGVFIKRVWLFIPIFAGIVVLPAIFSFVVPGKALVTIGGISITQPGVQTAVTVLLRVAVSVSLAALLVLTTRWEQLMRALTVLRIPKTAILVLEMTYRYIFLFLKTADGMHLARKSRMIRRLSGAEERRWVASRLGNLFQKSQRLSEDVYLAMQSRGFTGEIRTVYRPRFGSIEVAWLIVTAAVVGLVICANLLLR
ncbi:MAG: cobalt ECF transporter T component CbiQ [Actinomycetota bacterium]